jgi:palmitoyltransferase
MATSFFRLVFITIWDPPYLPLGAGAISKQDSEKGKGKAKRKDGSIAGGEYDPGNSSGDKVEGPTGYKDDPDSPGLELFYTKDVFVCEMDGKPRWCYSCANWKPDRSHHCSSSGRCILKMDHFCPWYVILLHARDNELLKLEQDTNQMFLDRVGGPVGENNFKFFIQFTGYTALYCTHLLVVMAIYIHRQVATEV